MGEQWTDEETWDLINEIRKKNNSKVLFGPEVGENTSGDSKNAVYKRIAEALNPEGTQLNPVKASERVKNKINSLQKKFRALVKQLKKTGEGVEEYYQVSTQGPDHDTDQRAVNIWDKIKKDWPFFPELWKIWSTKPNLVPICVTTGVGPRGQQTVFIQSQTGTSTTTPLGSSTAANAEQSELASLHHTISDSVIDPVLRQQSTSLVPPATPHASNISTASKENTPVSSGRHGPKPSSFAALGASGSADKVPSQTPQKRGYEDTLIDMSKTMMADINRRAEESHQAKKRKYDRLEREQILSERKLLLEEYKAGALDRGEYKEELARLNARVAKLDGDDTLFTPIPAPRAASPDWDPELLEKDLSGDEL
ncbi:hypothetical protein VKT23_015886 [Stygiomarasmius scandens]|uniref:Myb/SANT-like DNA-binding domain-containing protein n=1 Tax=Marasmiellus scandens TaxID=2682957 RepID=A0ABR1IW66_9AGAR